MSIFTYLPVCSVIFQKLRCFLLYKMVINNAVLSCRAVKSLVTSFSELSLGHGEGVMWGDTFGIGSSDFDIFLEIQ